MRTSLIGPVYPYRGGISHYTAMLARALSEGGHTSQVISFRRQYPARLYPGRTDRDPSPNPIRTEAEFLLDPLYPWTWLQAGRRIEAFNADLVVIQWWTTFWAPAFGVIARRLRRSGRRVAYILHNVLPHEQRRLDVPLARWGLSGAEAFVAQTRRERERLLELVPEAEVHDCPLPAYHLLAPSGRTRSEARQRLNLEPEGMLLLFFGFVRPYKGVEVLLEALGKLRAAGECPRLAIVGEFWQDKAGYLEQISRLGLGELVRIEDRYIPDDEVGDWFRAADALAAPYTAGTQSAAAGIALAHGLPILASRQVAEGIAPENQEALLASVPPGDAAALAEAISVAVERLKDAPERRPEAPGRGTGAAEWARLVETLERIAAGGSPG